MKSNIYLFKSGELKQKNNTLIYIVKNETEFIPIEEMDHIHAFGEIRLNKRVLQLLNKYKISITFYTIYGNIIGRFTPNSYKLGKMILKQSEAYLDIEKRIDYVYRMETASAYNCLSVVRYYKKKGYGTQPIISSLETIYKQMRKLDRTAEDYLTKITLYEARMKQIYYQVLDIILQGTGFEFGARITNPPGNCVNALMSFGYSLLYGDILNAIEKTDLIPEIAFIHGNSRRGKGSLQYDISDLFKAQIIDRVVLRLIRSSRIKKEHFYKTVNNGVYLNEEGRKIFVKEYNRMLKESHTDYRNKRKYTYKQFLSREVYELSNSIVNGKVYRPFLFTEVR